LSTLCLLLQAAPSSLKALLEDNVNILEAQLAEAAKTLQGLL
jgi:hypothetical protein